MIDTEIACAWVRTVEPAIEPLTIEEARAQARYTGIENDALLDVYIQAARKAAEEALGRGLLTQTWKYVLEDFADVMSLPMAAPLQSVTSVKYYDDAGTQQTLATSVYDIDVVSRPGAVVLKPGQTWPSLQALRRNGRVEIVYIVGWTDPAQIPELFKQGIRMFVTYLDLDRDGLEGRALEAKQAAERCWTDYVQWTPPSRCD